MMRNWIAGVLAMIALGSLGADENPLLQRGRIDGKEFSEVGRLYVDDDKLIHFRTDQRLYYFSHMYYIWDTLAESGVVKDGKITYDKPLRITGNYSKAAYVYNFLQEPALRGSQIVWIDRIEKAGKIQRRRAEEERHRHQGIGRGEAQGQHYVLIGRSKAQAQEQCRRHYCRRRRCRDLHLHSYCGRLYRRFESSQDDRQYHDNPQGGHPQRDYPHHVVGEQGR